MDVFRNWTDTGYVSPLQRAVKVKPKTAKPRPVRPAPKLRPAPKPRPAPKARPGPALTAPDEALELSKVDSRGQTLRSPGGMDCDPQLSLAEIERAMAFVRRHQGSKKEITWPQGQAWKEQRNKKGRIVVKGAPWKPCAYLTVAFGGGVDSTAILVGMDQLWRQTRDTRWVPLAVTFADTGSENPHTYEWVKTIDKWLKTTAFKGARNRPAGLVKVGHATAQLGSGKAKPGWGTAQTLEISSLINHTLPSISFGGHSCSLKWKITAQRDWIDYALEVGDLPAPRDQRQIARAIGYDATETERKEKGSTYSAKDEMKATQKRPKLLEGWYPLIEWGWDRARCAAEIDAVFGRFPKKSSCTFCGAMKPSEVRALAESYPELLERALFMELVFIHGRHRKKVAEAEAAANADEDLAAKNPAKKAKKEKVKGSTKGLGRAISWSDVARGKVIAGSKLWTVYALGGVVRSWPTKDVGLMPGSRGVLGQDGSTYVAYIPAGKEKVIRLLENERYVPPARLKGVPVGRLISEARFLELERLAKEWVLVTPKTPGQLGKDLALHPLTRKIAAFADVMGFRSSGGLTRERIKDELLPGAVDQGDRAKLSGLLARARGRKNPGRPLPLAGVDPQVPGGIERDPLLFGL